MKRLTAVSDVGEAYYPYCYREDTCDGEGGTEKCRDCEFSEKICETLAAYENTGLTPAEIVQLKERDNAWNDLKVKIRKKLELVRKCAPMSRREEGYEEALLAVLSMIHELEKRSERT